MNSLAELAEFELAQGFRLVPTPAEDPYIPLVSFATGRAICRFNKVEFARILGHDSSKCRKCRTSLVVVQ